MTGKSKTEERRERIISCADKCGDIGPLEDGFQYFFARTRGALSAFDLRAIADELDRRNAAWEAGIDRYFSSLKDPQNA